MAEAERLTDTITLYQGDCLEALPCLPKGFADAVITDPPYSDKTHAGARSNRRHNGSGGSNEIDFPSCGVELIRSAMSMCSPRRWCVSFVDWRHAKELEDQPPDGLDFIRHGIWTKLNPMPQISGDRPSTGWESVVMLHPAGRKKWNGGSGPAVWNYGTSRWGNFGPSNHPTEKPLPLIRKLVSQFTDPLETIIDPFAGSGTTAVAAMLEGRKCVLIEKDPGYCEAIRKRVRDASGVAVGTLFHGVASLFDN